MDVHPRLLQLATDFGKLLKAHGGEDLLGSNHAALALAEAFQNGLMADLNGTQTLDLPTSIADPALETVVLIRLGRNEDGTSNYYNLLAGAETASNGNFKIVDWLDIDQIRDRYEYLTEEQAKEVIACVDPSDLDLCVDSDAVREVLNEAVRAAGYDPNPDAAGDEDSDWSDHGREPGCDEL